MNTLYGSTHPPLALKESFPGSELIKGEVVVPTNAPFSINGLAETMEGVRNTFFFHPDINDKLPVDEYELKGAYFVEREDWKVGRENSVHNVFFGELTLESNDSNATQITIPVACKPYFSMTRGAIHEYASNLHVNELGFMDALNPIGLWVNESGMTFLLTEFEEEIVTLDNADWGSQGTNSGTRLDIFTSLERAAYALARWHGHGYAHGDAQIKNIAVDSRGVRAVDLESLQLVHTPDQPDMENMQAYMLKDLAKFLQSVAKTGYLAENRRQDALLVITDALVSPYKGVLRHPTSPLVVALGAEAVKIVDNVCDIAVGQLELALGT